MEKLFDTSNLVHDKALKRLFKRLKNVEISKIIDAGSGKVSASILLKYFPKASVDAVVYPGDNRKINPLETAIGSRRLEVVEADICSTCFRKKYDLCLAMLTLGEALHFGNSFEKLFQQILEIRSKYYVIYDILEDPCVHYRYMEEYFKERGYKLLKKKIFKNPHPEHYPKVKYDKYKLEFESKHFVGYLIEKI